MRMFIALCLVCVLNAQASPIQAQQSEILLNVKDKSLTEVLKMIQAQSSWRFLYSNELLLDTKAADVDIHSKDIREVMDACLKGKALDYEIQDKIIVIKAKTPQSQNQENHKIYGTVTDRKTGMPLPGVTVMIQKDGAPLTGTATSEKGSFEIIVPANTREITFTCVGYKSVTLTAQEGKEMTVRMQEEVSEINEVVVTGYFAKSKASFTGSVKSVSGAELKAISGTNVLQALSAITPGLEIVERSEFGSDPNKVPELLLRGMSSFSNQGQEVNQPTIILDGTEVSMQDLYDLDMNEIENITVLKDASASALYGARAANGVIVIDRKKITESKMRVNYNFTANVQFPDTRDYKILNATEKLEYERQARLYVAEGQKDEWGQPRPNAYQYTLDSLYNLRYKEIQRGVNSDWMAQPSRVGFSHDHSLRLYGGTPNVRYELSGRFNDVKGVMKEDYRKRYNLGFKLEYYLKDKFTFSNRTTYAEVTSQLTPYGDFEEYTRMNPYDRMYDQFGKPNRQLSWNLDNPLYEAELGNSNREGSKILTNTLDLRWDINSLFRITSHFTIETANGQGEIFYSPDSQKFKEEKDINKKGSFTKTDSKGVNYSGNLIGAFNRVTDNNSLISLTGGFEIRRDRYEETTLEMLGFFDNNLGFPGQAAGYPTSTPPTGKDQISSEIGGFLNANYMYNNRYYADFVYRITGSSKFGSNNRYGQFWSGGLGWNLHNESFLKSEQLNLLKIRGSLGYTGKVNFEPYQAMTIYRYSSDLEYRNGIGSTPITIGNRDLKWEREFSYNLGVDVSVLDRRLNFTADLYLKKTTDLLLDDSKAPSTGVITGKENIGEMQNKGIEIQMDGFIIRKDQMYWQLGFMGYANRNKILKINNALKEQNKENNNDNKTIAPLGQFEENESTSALKVVRSGGIDPATGQEVYFKLNGERTFEYTPDDKIVIGDTEPKFRGKVNTTFFFKGFSVYALFDFKCGGYLYNITRATKVEGADPKKNADSRVFYDRWKQAGDIAMYKDIADKSSPRQTTRFVEKENVFSLVTLNFAYEFDRSLCQRIGMNSLRLGVNLKDLFRASSVEIERGTTYLYSNGFEFTLSTTF